MTAAIGKGHRKRRIIIRHLISMGKEKQEYVLCIFSMRHTIHSANIGNFPYNDECYSSL